MSALFKNTFLILLLAGCSAMPPQPKFGDSRPEILKLLDGHWVMSGDVLGKPVTYMMEAAPTLHATFTELHMSDVQVPPKYEARVFIGYDQASKTVIAHWMDSFGAQYSIPHGTGNITGNSIQFLIPYQSGSFRDTLTYRPDEKSWRLVIEALQPDGTWKHFARYDIRQNQ